MDIVAVDYQRLVNLGNYENERLGATASVAAHEDPNIILAQLQEWVGNQILATKEAKTNLRMMQEELEDSRHALTRLESKIQLAKERWEKIQAWFTKTGIAFPGGWETDDNPF